VLTDVDDDSVRRAMNICYQLHKHKSIFDCLVVSPYQIEARLEAQVIRNDLKQLHVFISFGLLLFYPPSLSAFDFLTIFLNIYTLNICRFEQWVLSLW
jgi:hypothetical protein